MPETSQPAPRAGSDLAGAWALDPRRTTIQFQTKALWIRTVEGTLRAVDGNGTVDGDGLASGRVVFDATSIDTSNKRRDEHLRHADFFDAEHYPTVLFEVAGSRITTRGLSTITGDLSIRGVSRPVRLQAAVQPRADGAVTVSAETEIDRSAWGMTWTRMGAGIHNRVTIEATFIRS